MSVFCGKQKSALFSDMHWWYPEEKGNENPFSIWKLSSLPKAQFPLISTLKLQISHTLISSALQRQNCFYSISVGFETSHKWTKHHNCMFLIFAHYHPSQCSRQGALQTGSAQYLLERKALFYRHIGLCTYYNKPTNTFYTQYPLRKISSG